MLVRKCYKCNCELIRIYDNLFCSECDDYVDVFVFGDPKDDTTVDNELYNRITIN